MRLPRVTLFLLVLALAAPASAASARVLVTPRDEPLEPLRTLAADERVLAERAAPSRFNLVGLHWRGAGSVSFRTHSRERGWSAWRPARPEGEDGPDATSPEAARRLGWKIGNPYWTGASERIQYRLRGRVSRLRAQFVWSPPAPVRRPAIAPAPSIISRADWRANEAMVRARPTYAGSLGVALVHHTAGASPSSPAESAAIVRGIQAYHVRGNGWNDIGYNFLVDRFGQVFEGRGGGVDRNVIGAHAQGFNTGSVGVAVIGTYGSEGISSEASSALASLLAWKLDLAHVDPLSRVIRTSAGSSRYRAGARVNLAAVSGHRDTGYTSCPGAALYAALPSLAQAAAAIGLPKLYEPRAAGLLGDPVRFTARLSAPLDWTVTVADATGAAVASGRGSGQNVDWTWSSAGVPDGAYSYAITAGPDVLPATGWVGRRVPLEVAALRARPRVFTPNGDGDGDETSLVYSLTAPGKVRVWLRAPSGAEVATLAPARVLPAGTRTVRWKGLRLDGTAVPDGRYRVVVDAATEREKSTRSATVVVDRSLGRLAVRPNRFSPNGDARLDTLELGFDLALSAKARVTVRAGARMVATVFAGTLAGGGRQTFSWDGKSGGRRVGDGEYAAVVQTTTGLGTRTLVRPFTVDTRRPRLSAATALRRRRGTLVRFTLSEEARIRIWVGRKAFAFTRASGQIALRLPAKAERVRLVAWDRAGNASRPLRLRARR